MLPSEISQHVDHFSLDGDSGGSEDGEGAWPLERDGHTAVARSTQPVSGGAFFLTRRSQQVGSLFLSAQRNGDC